MHGIKNKWDRLTATHVPRDMETTTMKTLVVWRVRDDGSNGLSTRYIILTKRYIQLENFQDKEQGAIPVQAESIRTKTDRSSQVANNARMAQKAHIGGMMLARSPVIMGCT